MTNNISRNDCNFISNRICVIVLLLIAVLVIAFVILFGIVIRIVVVMVLVQKGPLRELAS